MMQRRASVVQQPYNIGAQSIESDYHSLDTWYFPTSLLGRAELHTWAPFIQSPDTALEGLEK